MNPSSTLSASDSAASTLAPSAPRIAAVYRVTAPAAEIEARARDIAYEQTVEVPPSLVSCPIIQEQIVGRVEQIAPVAGERQAFDVQVSYNSALAGGQLPQLLNLVYGNISLKNGIRLIDLDLPDDLLARFRGPNLGVEGLRRWLGVYDRPLLATALKPVGSSAAELATAAYEFALGGGDLVKDDHNLQDASFEQFQKRVSACQAATEAANVRTGRQCLYLPNLCAPFGELERQLEFVRSQGIAGVLVAPLVLGFDVVRHLAEQRPLLVMAHPTMSGTFFHDPQHGVAPGILLGTLFRLCGADLSIFPNAGGRFSFTDLDCRQIARRLRSPLGRIKESWPAPAGGMRFDNIGMMTEQFGRDSVFLIGGALLSDSASLADSTARFLARIEEHFPARLETPAPIGASACELPARGATPAPAPQQRLAFQPDFSWTGRTPVVYKSNGTLPFQDVARHELVGQAGEQTAFDLRYFEIAPGGFSSLEKHEHTHVVIGVRGRGVLQCGETALDVTPLDVAYVPPWQVHQLRNAGPEPFGFFCIVNHDRDRPLPP